MADSPNRDTAGETTGTTDTRTAEDHPPGRGRTVDLRGSKLLAGLASLIGAWIAVSPFVYGDLGAATDLGAGGWNNVIVGAAIFLIAGANFYRLSKDRNVSTAAASLVTLLGLWVVVAAFAVFDMGTTGLLSSTVVSGLITAAIGAYNAYKGRQASDRRTAARTG